PQTTLYTKIRELWSTIFNNNNEVITCGTVENEFNNLHHLDFTNLDQANYTTSKLSTSISQEHIPSALIGTQYDIS
ncbi:unnamed protein product, partial [Rotaria socialis]